MDQLGLVQGAHRKRGGQLGAVVGLGPALHLHELLEQRPAPTVQIVRHAVTLCLDPEAACALLLARCH